MTKNNTQFKKGAKPWNLGLKLSEEHKAKLHKPHTGKIFEKEYRDSQSKIAKERGYGKWNKGRIYSQEERRKQSERLKRFYDKVGRKNKPEFLFRETSYYAKWRKAVFERDNYTCKICNITNVYLHADHIKPFSLFPELRLDISNGRTLCVPCHRKTDTWGRKNKSHADILKANGGNSW